MLILSARDLSRENMALEMNHPNGVDTTRAGATIFISDDVPLQKILYAVEDVLGNQVYYTEEAERYINDSRNRRSGQRFVLRYLDKIPAILKDPSIVILDPDDVGENTMVYYKEFYVSEKEKHVLFALIVKLGFERIVYNLHPQNSGKVKSGREKQKVIFLKSGYKRTKYF
ncbi:MAG: hypothetical protein ACE5I1_13975 [bacterium]